MRSLLLHSLSRILGRPGTASFPTGMSHFERADRGGAVVVSKFSGWGSVLEIAPLLEGVRRRFPRSRLVLVTSWQNEPLTRRLPFIDEAIFLPISGSDRSVPKLRALELALRVRRLAPALFLDLQLHTRKDLSMAFSLLSGADIRIGFVGHSDGARLSLLTHALYYNALRSVGSAHAQVASLLGIDLHDPRPFLLKGDPEDVRHFRAAFPDPDRVTPLCVINPNASERALERRWPLDHFRELIDRLLEDRPSLEIALIGSTEEEEYVLRLENSLSPRTRVRVHNVAGRLTFGGLVQTLRRATVFVTNDSGPLHLGLFLGTPTVGLFGPTDPALIVDRRQKESRSIFLYEPFYCSPCVHQVIRPPCGGDNLCLQTLSVDRVLRACDFLLGKGRDGRMWRKDSPGFVTERLSGVPVALFHPRTAPCLFPTSMSGPSSPWEKMRERGR